MGIIPHLPRIGPLVSASRGGSEQIESLTEKLSSFYNTTQEYTAFNTPQPQIAFLGLIAEEIKTKFQQNGTETRVLEVGAGCGSAFEVIKDLDRGIFHYTAQDITQTVLGRLAQVANAVHFGPLGTLRGQFDVIFSLFVFEHITTPVEFLGDIHRLLVPGGTHVIICPRYDVPGFVCPSLRHLRPVEILRIEAQRHFCNALAHYRKEEPAFFVNTDPAFFHQRWRRDADAVHIVCENDVIRWHSRKGYRVRKLIPKTVGLLDMCLKRFATVCVAFDKPA